MGPLEQVAYATGFAALVTATLLAGCVLCSGLQDGLTELLGSSGH